MTSPVSGGLAKSRQVRSVYPGKCHVFGFDYCGFSDWVHRAFEERGDNAAEWVSERLDLIFERISSGLLEAGFGKLESLGDGLLAASCGAPTRNAFLSDIVARAGLGLRFRSATVFGEIRPIPILDTLTLWAGNGVSRCHEAMRRATLCPSEHNSNGAALTAPQRLLHASLASGTVGFLCLRQGEVELEDRFVQDVARLAGAAAAAAGSEVEKATLDEKGILFRAHFTTSSLAYEWANCLVEGLSSVEDFGIGIASGLVYRLASSDGAPATVHGDAVNRAAKLAGRARGLAGENGLGKQKRSPPQDDACGKGAMLREAEEAELASAFANGLRLVELLGEPGLGKSYLLARFLATRTERVARAIARPQNLLDPFAVLRDVLLSVASGRDERALCERRHVIGEAALLAWGDEICGALAQRCDQGPVLVAIDDLQWADAWSLDALASSRISGMRLLVARRPGPTTLVADCSITLRPLEDYTIAKLLGTRWENESKLIRLAAGNPFYALQMASALRDGIDIHDFTDAETIVEARLRTLGDIERAILRLAAIADRPLRYSAFAALAKRSTVTFSRSELDELVSRGFLQMEDDSYSVIHQLLSGHLLRTLPSSLTPILNDHAARTFTALSRAEAGAFRLEEIAAHWERAGVGGRASLCFGEAGLDALERGAHAASLIFLDSAERCLSTSSAGLSRRGLWAASRGLAAWGQGNVTVCASEADRAFRLLKMVTRGGCPISRRRRRSAQLRGSVAQAEAGHYQGNVGAILRGNLGTIRWGSTAGDNSNARARGLAFVATTLGVLRIESLAGIITRYALTVDERPRAAAYVHAARAVLHFGFGRWDRALARLDQASRNLFLEPEPQLEEVLLTLTALKRQMTGDLDGAREKFAELGSKGRVRANPLIEAWSRYGRCMALVGEGEYDEACADVRDAQRILHGLGDLQSELICRGLLAQALTDQDPHETLRICDEASVLGRRLPPTNFGSLEGYSGGAIALARLLRSGRAPCSSNSIIERYQALRVPLARFAWMFPIGRPRLAFADALVSGDERRMTLASVAASKIGMLQDSRNMNVGGLWRL